MQCALGMNALAPACSHLVTSDLCPALANEKLLCEGGINQQIVLT
jgi:hypothetical protein